MRTRFAALVLTTAVVLGTVLATSAQDCEKHSHSHCMTWRGRTG